MRDIQCRRSLGTLRGVGKVDAKDEMPAVPANLKEITDPATLIYFFRFARVRFVLSMVIIHHSFLRRTKPERRVAFTGRSSNTRIVDWRVNR